MGDAMSLMAPGRCPYRPRASGGSGGVTLSWKNGTEIPTSVRVLRNGLEIAAAAPANSAELRGHHRATRHEQLRAPVHHAR